VRGRVGRSPASLFAGCALAAVVAACGGDGDTSLPPNLAVRQRIDALAPANLAHRGAGPNRQGNTFAENSLAAFRDAMRRGADGVELDVELTADGELLVLHDDTLDRTTTCTGCLSALSFDAARQCRLINIDRQVSDETLPTLAEVYGALPPQALVNVELKVYAGVCLTPTTDGMTLARAAAAEVRRLGAASRTLFSSFDEAPIVGLKHEQPDLYAALLTGGPPPGEFERVAGLGLDAIHPFFSSLTATRIAAAKELGLQVNLWTVDGRAFLQRSVDYQASAIITDEPGVLAAVKAGREDE